MSDHEFEKQVQHRMDEFRVRPSEAVWATVEKRVRQKRRRRKVVMWLPVMLLSIGAAGYFIVQSNSNHTDKNFTHSTTVQPNTSVTTEEKDQSNKATTTLPDQATDQTDANPSGADNQKATEPGVTSSDPLTDPDQPTAIHPPSAGKGNATDQPAGIHKNNSDRSNETKAFTGTATNSSREKKGRSQHPNNKNRKGQQGISDVTLAANNPSGKNNKENFDRAHSIKNDETIHTNKAVTDEQPDLLALITLPAINNTDANDNPGTSAIAKKKFDPTSIPVTTDNNNATVTAVISRKKRSASKWEWGVQAYGGASHIAKGGLGDIFKRNAKVEDLAKSADMSPDPNLYGLPNLPPPKNEPSSIRIGKAWSAGVFVQRPVAKRLSLSAALNYAYYSVYTTVGLQEDKTLSVNNGLNNSQLVIEYYQGTTARQGSLPNNFAYAPPKIDYENRYHFIELPVMLHVQLNKGKRLPLIADAGVVVGRMVSTNALHYDGVNDVYYENYDFYNKWQLGLAAGFNVGLFPNSAHPLWVGPRINYQTTNQIRKDISEGQHLWSFGLGAKFFLKK